MSMDTPPELPIGVQRYVENGALVVGHNLQSRALADMGGINGICGSVGLTPDPGYQGRDAEFWKAMTRISELRAKMQAACSADSLVAGSSLGEGNIRKANEDALDRLAKKYGYTKPKIPASGMVQPPMYLRSPDEPGWYVAEIADRLDFGANVPCGPIPVYWDGQYGTTTTPSSDGVHTASCFYDQKTFRNWRYLSDVLNKADYTSMLVADESDRVAWTLNVGGQHIPVWFGLEAVEDNIPQHVQHWLDNPKTMAEQPGRYVERTEHEALKLELAASRDSAACLKMRVSLAEDELVGAYAEIERLRAGKPAPAPKAMAPAALSTMPNLRPFGHWSPE